jgi:phage baseplate assembly protein W
MSWSLRVSNGDFVLDGRSFGVVTNENKLVQDFRHYLLTHMGQDPAYPWYGSLIDGGIKPNGQYVESPIASTNWESVKLRIEAEVRRIANSYQQQQIDRAQADRARYNKSTLSLGEILAAVTDIRFQQTQDTLNVEIALLSGRNDQQQITFGLPALG